MSYFVGQDKFRDIIQLLCETINTLDEDFVPGPKLADLENRFHELTGLHRGDPIPMFFEE